MVQRRDGCRRPQGARDPAKVALYSFQIEGARFLASHRRVYLADEMGLGKSAQAITAAAAVGARRPLVVCPASAIENWHREFDLWWPDGPEPGTMSYAKLVHGAEPHGFDLVVLDEAQYVKNSRAKRTRLALALARKGRWAWLLSGTPMPNHPGELWAPIKALWPGVPRTLGLRTEWDWFDHFCVWKATRYGPKVVGTRNLDRLRPYLRRLMLRRRLADVGLDLPPLRIHLSLLPRDPAFEEALRRLGDLADYDALLRDMEIAARLRHFLGKYKAPLIAEIVAEELKDRQYAQVVVMAHHRDVLDRMRRVFEEQGLAVLGFDGSTPLRRRQFAIDAFQAGSAPVLLAQQQAGGLAINLTAASEMVVVEPDWSPENNVQAVKRIHRIGQDAPCRARIFAVVGTLDESIMETNARKTRAILETLPR